FLEIPGNFFSIEQSNVYPPQSLNQVVSYAYLQLLPLPVLMDLGCIPKPYLEIGDSIFLTKEFKINSNFKPGSTNTPDPPLIGFRTAIQFGESGLSEDSLLHFKFQYSGWNL
ncbi:MAG TPA: hypothetical protein DCF33_15135, partial [Saprospirales bacterium]|nr:hypothetical protein [Saprospirales bacterium]